MDKQDNTRVVTPKEIPLPKSVERRIFFPEDSAEIRPITHTQTPWGDFTNEGTPINTNRAIRNLSEGIEAALVGDDDEDTNFVTGLVPGADAAIKISKGKRPGLMDLPAASDVKTAVIPLMGAANMKRYAKKFADRVFGDFGDAVQGDFYKYKHGYNKNGDFRVRNAHELETENFVNSLDNMPDEFRDMIVRTALAGERRFRDRPYVVSSKGIGSFDPNSGRINLGNQYDENSDLSSVLLHEMTHNADYALESDKIPADRLFRTISDGEGLLMQPVIDRMFANAKSEEDFDKVYHDMFSKFGGDAAAKKMTGLMVDARGNTFVNPIDNSVLTGPHHPTTYRDRIADAARQFGVKNPENAALAVESFANIGQVLGEKGGEQLMIDFAPDVYDKVMFYAKEHPKTLLLSDKALIPEEFLE